MQNDGEPAVGARVFATRDSMLLSRATTDATGAFTIHVPVGETVLSAFVQGQRMSPEVTVSAPASDATLQLGPSGTVTLSISDGAEPIPAFVQAIPRGREAVRPPRAFGEHRIVSGRSAVVYSFDGTAEMRLAAGDYDVLVTRGYEWNHASLDVTVGDETVDTRDVELIHEIQTPGVMCGDFHIHTERSFDTRDSATLKVHAIAAQGVEIALRSDHEWVGSFEPLIALHGLEDRVFGITSLELTTFSYGHFGVFPLDIDPTARNRGAPDWVGVDAPTLLAGVERGIGVDGPPRVIINHPRSGLDILATSTRSISIR